MLFFQFGREIFVFITMRVLFFSAEICRQQIDGHVHSMMLNGSEWRSNNSAASHASVKPFAAYVEQSSTNRPGIDDVIASAERTEPVAVLPTASTSIAESISKFNFVITGAL
jgi:hypothetical protein